MFRVLIAPEFAISPSNPDFPPVILEALKTARDETGSKYVSFWAEVGGEVIKSNIVVSTYPEAWLQEYSEQNYSRIDPVIQKGLPGVGAIIFDHASPEDEALVPLGAGALAHGIGKYTIGIPVHIAGNIRSVTTFATDIDVTGDPEETSETLVKCREQAHILSVTIIEPFFKSATPKVNLTKREIEILYWGAHGKTDQQTSEIMGISRWTVIAHLQSAKAKLRVNNKAAAIARATELHLFSDFDQKL